VHIINYFSWFSPLLCLRIKSKPLWIFFRTSKQPPAFVRILQRKVCRPDYIGVREQRNGKFKFERVAPFKVKHMTVLDARQLLEHTAVSPSLRPHEHHRSAPSPATSSLLGLSKYIDSNDIVSSDVQQDVSITIAECDLHSPSGCTVILMFPALHTMLPAETLGMGSTWSESIMGQLCLYTCFMSLNT
jgi:hypothetical protein